MAHVTDILAPHFTGHVGPVRFVNGHGETDDPELVAYFAADPDRYTVTATDEPAEPYTDATQRQVDALERGMPHDLVATITNEQDDDTQE